MNKNIIYLLSITCSSQLFCAQDKEILVMIDHVVQKISPQTTCAVTEWANKLENACICCLVKQAPLLAEKTITASEIINNCITNGLCNETIIDTLSEKHGGANKTEDVLKKLIMDLYEKSVMIKEIEATDTMVDKFLGGYFTPEGLKIFLETAHATGKLPNPDFKQVACLNTNNIQDAEAGKFTNQLFSITSSCSVPSGRQYILKEVGPIEGDIIAEPYALLQASLMPGIQEFVYSHDKKDSNKNFPSIVLPEAYFSYTYDNMLHILELMPKAPGIRLYDYQINFANNTAKAAHAYKTLGSQMAHFYKKFMQHEPGKILGPTITHGDFHNKNIFFDEASDKISLIDNVNLILSAKKHRDISEDIANIFYTFMNIKKKDEKNLWFYTITKNFIEGYLQAYEQEPITTKEKIVDELHKKLHSKKDQYSMYKEYIDRAVQDVLASMQPNIPFDVQPLEQCAQDLALLAEILTVSYSA
ncbi:MAG: hypothetical protein WC707_06585 [Candidatus Babeliaceae bacterium]